MTLKPGLYQRDLAALRVVTSKLLDDGIAYVRLRGFAPDFANRALTAISRLRTGRTLTGVVLDLRGNGGGSAIGTLVERSTRYVMLVHLPIDRTAERMRDALIETMASLPAQLKRSLTWDQGSEMGRHHEFTLAADMPVYFCDPASPWQRGSNENTYWAVWGAWDSSDGRCSALGRWVTRRTRAGRLSVDLSIMARRARALAGSDLIEAC